MCRCICICICVCICVFEQIVFVYLYMKIKYIYFQGGAMISLSKHNNRICAVANVIASKKAGHQVNRLLNGEHHESHNQQFQVLLRGRQLLLPRLCYLHLRLSSKGFFVYFQVLVRKNAPLCDDCKEEVKHFSKSFPCASSSRLSLAFLQVYQQQC